MSEQAKQVQDGERAAGNKGMQGFVFQGKAYEGLGCNALEWINSYNGGSVVEPDGKISINNPGALAALTMAHSWIGTIAPQGVLNYGEEDARAVFQKGEAVFMRNWPYAWGLSQAKDSVIADKVGIAPLPAGSAEGHPAATLGGWSLAVSKYSKNPALAAAFVMYLTSSEVQKDRSINGSYNPTLTDLYKDPEVLIKNPFYRRLYKVFTNAVPRPATATGARYPEVSNAFWHAVHDVLSGKKDAKPSLAELEGKLKQIRRGETWQ